MLRKRNILICLAVATLVFVVIEPARADDEAEWWDDSYDDKACCLVNCYVDIDGYLWMLWMDWRDMDIQLVCTELPHNSIGSNFIYRITYDNALNPMLDATHVVIVDTMPIELDYVSSDYGN